MTGPTPPDGSARFDDGDPPLDEAGMLLTAWLDGELTVADNQRFEAMMRGDAELAREAAEQKALLDLTRGMTTMEPTELEERRFWTHFYNRTEWQVAWVLLLVGLIGVVGESVWLLLSSPTLSWVMKSAALLALTGGALLVWNTARLKMRTSRFDRYRGVMR